MIPFNTHKEKSERLDMEIMNKFRINFVYATLLAALLVTAVPSGVVSAASQPIGRAEVGEAQDIMNDLNIPNGPRDGLNGPNTGQGLCIFRTISGLKPSRKNLDAETLAKLREFGNNSSLNKMSDIPAPIHKGQKTYLYASLPCQAMLYVWQQKYFTVIPISSGVAGKETPFGAYTLKGTVKGWTCSNEYPDTCAKQTAGINVNYKAADGTIRNFGNMYNKREFKEGGFYIHGSNFSDNNGVAPTYPGSAGCIRVSIVHAEWLSKYVPEGTKLFVAGRYNEADRPKSAAAIRAEAIQNKK